jgi:hypothetical protein
MRRYSQEFAIGPHLSAARALPRSVIFPYVQRLCALDRAPRCIYGPPCYPGGAQNKLAPRLEFLARVEWSGFMKRWRLIVKLRRNGLTSACLSNSGTQECSNTELQRSDTSMETLVRLNKKASDERIWYYLRNPRRCTGPQAINMRSIHTTNLAGTRHTNQKISKDYLQ